MKRKYLYLFLAIVGLCWTWYFNLQFLQTDENPTMRSFIAQCLTTLPAKSISADITVVCLTFFVWMISEGLRLNMKIIWLLIPSTLFIALAFTFPLFLFFREQALSSQKEMEHDSSP